MSKDWLQTKECFKRSSFTQIILYEQQVMWTFADRENHAANENLLNLILNS